MTSVCPTMCVVISYNIKVFADTEKTDDCVLPWLDLLRDFEEERNKEVIEIVWE